MALKKHINDCHSKSFENGKRWVKNVVVPQAEFLAAESSRNKEDNKENEIEDMALFSSDQENDYIDIKEELGMDMI